MSIFPREGVTIDFLWSLVDKYALRLEAALILLPLICFPGPAFLHTIILRRSAVVLSLIITFYNINKWLSKRSINNNTRIEPINFDNQTVVITGGSSGIGESVVEQILGQSTKVKVVIIDIAAPKEKLRSRVHFYQCDLSNHEAAIATAQAIQREIGDPTILVNNAGLSRGSLMAEADWTDVSVTLRVNLIAPFILIRQFIPAMINKDSGHVVNIGSLSALIPPAGLADYAASKAGLIAMSESLRMELRHIHHAPRVRVSSMILSFVNTPLFKGKTNQFEFFTPLLHVNTCGEEIVKTIASGESRVVYMPNSIGIAPAGWLGPRWIQDAMLDATAKLDVDFKGRQKVDKNGYLEQE